jgi:predicted RNase H-like nuclease (RuvC/YqgF family)
MDDPWRYLMDDVYDANGPTDLPLPKSQPPAVEDPTGEGEEQEKGSGVQTFIERWKKEVLDKITFLKESLEQANRDKEALSREVDRLQAELEAARTKSKEMEVQYSETLDSFYKLLDDVSKALEG